MIVIYTSCIYLYIHVYKVFLYTCTHVWHMHVQIWILSLHGTPSLSEQSALHERGGSHSSPGALLQYLHFLLFHSPILALPESLCKLSRSRFSIHCCIRCTSGAQPLLDTAGGHGTAPVQSTPAWLPYSRRHKALLAFCTTRRQWSCGNIPSAVSLCFHHVRHTGLLLHVLSPSSHEWEADWHLPPTEEYGREALHSSWPGTIERGAGLYLS